MENNLKIKIYLHYEDQGVVQPDGTIGTQNIKDYYVNVPLINEYHLYDDYVDVQRDPLRVDMQRQLINPWFIELGFFESVKTTGITGATSNNNHVLVPANQNLIRKAENFSITINK